nr:MAG TPA: hypothetical protein [Caudoviricetes sp.]
MLNRMSIICLSIAYSTKPFWITYTGNPFPF